MLDAQRLSSAIKQRGLTARKLADNIGVNRSTFYRKMRAGGSNFMLWEIESIIKFLGLTKHDAMEIFLA